MATWTDYDSERDAELALAELTGARAPAKQKESESDADRYVDLEAGS